MGCISLIFAYVFQRNAEAKSWLILPAVGDKALGPGVVSRFCLHGDDPIDGILKDEIHLGAVVAAPKIRSDAMADQLQHTVVLCERAFETAISFRFCQDCSIRNTGDSTENPQVMKVHLEKSGVRAG